MSSISPFLLVATLVAAMGAASFSQAQTQTAPVAAKTTAAYTVAAR